MVRFYSTLTEISQNYLRIFHVEYNYKDNQLFLEVG